MNKIKNYMIEYSSLGVNRLTKNMKISNRIPKNRFIFDDSFDDGDSPDLGDITSQNLW